MRAASIIDTTRTLIYRCAKLLRIFYSTKLFVRFLTHGRRDSVYLDNFLAFFRDLSINGACPYKFEKNPGFFLESKENRRNFALS